MIAKRVAADASRATFMRIDRFGVGRVQAYEHQIEDAILNLGQRLDQAVSRKHLSLRHLCAYESTQAPAVNAMLVENQNSSHSLTSPSDTPGSRPGRAC